LIAMKRLAIKAKTCVRWKAFDSGTYWRRRLASQWLTACCE